MQGTQCLSNQPLAPITLTVREDKARGKMSSEIANDKDFLSRLRNVLSEAGLGGSYTLDALTRVKGSPHRQGFTISLPRPNRHTIELLWQPRGNDSCYSVALIVPRSYDLFEFHRKLDDAAKAIHEREDVRATAERSRGSRPKSDQTEDGAIVENPSSLPGIEEFLRVVMKNATSTGVVSVEVCMDLLRTTLSCMDPQGFMVSLVEQSVLVRHNNSDAFVRITQEWLDLLQSEASYPVVRPPTNGAQPPRTSIVAVPPAPPPLQKEPVLVLVPAASATTPAPLSEEAPVASMGTLLSQLTRLKRLAKEAAHNRARALELDAEIEGRRNAIAEEQRRLDLLLAEREKVNRALLASDVVDAERQLAEIEAELAKE